MRPHHDGRFSGGTSGLSIGHVSPEAASGGEIGIIRDGDTIDIDIPSRRIDLCISEQELAERMAAWSVRNPSAATARYRNRSAHTRCW